MRVMVLRENPHLLNETLEYIQSKWANEESMALYKDSLTTSLTSKSCLPQWYLLYDKEEIIGCAGMVTNDFISRMDLYPWFCALFIEEKYRGKSYGKQLINKVKADASSFGFSHLYLSTDHIGYYEKYAFTYLAKGYHPWGESSRIYMAELVTK